MPSAWDFEDTPNPLADLLRISNRAPMFFARSASWLQESEELGDPQWSAPCGGTLKDPGKPTGAITKIQGGEKLHIRIREMAFHPSFYRVALAVNSRAELPPDPEPISETGSNGRQRSVSGAIHYPPAPPVLADGLFMHVAPFEFDKDLDF